MKSSTIRTRLLSLSLLTFLLLTMQTHLSRADVGTAAHYGPPHTPTACFGNDPSQFPSSNLFAAAGEGIWDNGASCGRQYLVRCISASVSGNCIPSQTIQVRIVDRALSSSSHPSSNGTTIVLSTTAFGTIAKSFATAVNVEYQHAPATAPVAALAPAAAPATAAATAAAALVAATAETAAAPAPAQTRLSNSHGTSVQNKYDGGNEHVHLPGVRIREWLLLGIAILVAIVLIAILVPICCYCRHPFPVRVRRGDLEVEIAT